MLRRRVTVLVLLALAVLPGCGAPPHDRLDETDGLRVAVSLPPQAWLVEQIAGERARIEVILPPALSPETWAPSPAAMLAVGKADLFFAVGHPSIGFERRLISQAEASGRQTILFARSTAAPAGSETPHPWLDPSVMRQTAGPLARRLGELDPAGATLFLANAERVESEIDALEERLASLLVDRRRDLVVVQHPAWSPLLRRYGIEEVAIERDGKEPDPTALIELVERVRREEVPVIFTQRGTSPRSARLIGAETGARIVLLEPLARDWPAALERAINAFAQALR